MEGLILDQDNFYSNVKVVNAESLPLGKRIRSLLDEVIQRLPDEKQFHIRGIIGFTTRDGAMTLWNDLGPQMGIRPELRPRFIDGNCTYQFGETVDKSMYIITIIVDDLADRSDGYIKGLIVHELAELSYSWTVNESNLPSLKKMKPKARQVKMNQLTKQDAPKTSMEYREHETTVNNEATRLGFEKEIIALDSSR